MSEQEYDPSNLQEFVFDKSFVDKVKSEQAARFLLLLSMPWDTIGTFFLRYFRLFVDYMNSHGILHGPTQGFMINIAALHPVITLTCIAGVAVITAFACMYFYFDESYKTQLKKQDAKNTHELINTKLSEEKQDTAANDEPLRVTIVESPAIEKKRKITAFLIKPIDEQNRILKLVLKKRGDEFSQMKNSTFKQGENGKVKLISKPLFDPINMISAHWMMITLAVVMYWILWISVAPLTGVLGVGVVGLSPFIGFGLPLAAGLGYLTLRAKHFFDHRKEDSTPNLDDKMALDNLLIACSEDSGIDIDPPASIPTKNKYFYARMASVALFNAVNTHLILQYAFWYASDMFPILAVGTTLSALSWAAIILPVIVAGVAAYYKYQEMIKEEPEALTIKQLEENKQPKQNEAYQNRNELDENAKNHPALHTASMLTGKAIDSNFNKLIQAFMTAAFIARLYTLGSTSPFVFFNVMHAAAWLTFPVTLGIIGAVGIAYAAYKVYAFNETFEKAATLRNQIKTLENEIRIENQLKFPSATIRSTTATPRTPTPTTPPSSAPSPKPSMPVLKRSPSNEETSWWNVSFLNVFNKPLCLSPFTNCRTVDDASSPKLKRL